MSARARLPFIQAQKAFRALRHFIGGIESPYLDGILLTGNRAFASDRRIIGVYEFDEADGTESDIWLTEDAVRWIVKLDRNGLGSRLDLWIDVEDDGALALSVRTPDASHARFAARFDGVSSTLPKAILALVDVPADESFDSTFALDPYRLGQIAKACRRIGGGEPIVWRPGKTRRDSIPAPLHWSCGRLSGVMQTSVRVKPTQTETGR